MGDNDTPQSRPQWPAGESWGPPPGPPSGLAGPPPGQAGPPGATPWAAPGPPRKKSRVLLAVLIGVAVLAVACVGAAGFGAYRVAKNVNAAAERPSGPLPPGLPGASEPAGDEDDAVDGPQASSYPVRKDEDLQRVCDQWYYPQSPKYQDAAVNPVSVLLKDSKDFDTRSEKKLWDIPKRSGSVKQAWDPPSPQNVRLVACVDLVESGKRVKSCQFEEPDGKLPMRQGLYRLTLYEVATGRKITEKRLTGEGQECPYFVLLGKDRTVYSSVEDRQIFESLRTYVEN